MLGYGFWCYRGWQAFHVLEWLGKIRYLEAEDLRKLSQLSIIMLTVYEVLPNFFNDLAPWYILNTRLFV